MQTEVNGLLDENHNFKLDANIIKNIQKKINKLCLKHFIRDIFLFITNNILENFVKFVKILFA